MKVTQIHLVRRPAASPRPDDFDIVTAALPSLRPGQVLVENLYMSVDPYMRRSMEAEAKDLEPWPIGGALNGPCVGRVLDSRNPGFMEGDIVESMSGWQSHFVSDGDAFLPYLTPDNALARRTVGNGIEPQDYLGLFGIAAMTGYVGVVRSGKLERGKTLVVSSAAGTVGSVACQVGKISGMRVVASAGSNDKINWLLHSAKVDRAFNYKIVPLADGLKEACPLGIDLVLENASPEHLEACLPLMNERGAVMIAGFVSIYTTGGRASPVRNLEYVLDKYLTLKAFPFMDYLDSYEEFVGNMSAWRSEGKLVFPQIIHDGLDQAPRAFCSLFSGDSFGKNLVRIAI
jgi:NADPH-dependent curcumin reductase CurA